MTMKKTFTLIATLVLAFAAPVFPADGEEGFVPLFNGQDLTGWKLRNPTGDASWSVKDGALVNDVSGGKHGTDLVTEKKFWNFTVRYEFMVPDGQNSGFYLRGRHEIQVLGDYKGGKPSKGSNGAIYGVKIPIAWHSWQEYSEKINPDPGAHFHFGAHMCPDLTRIRTQLGYAPRYTPEQSMERAVAWMRQQKML